MRSSTARRLPAASIAALVLLGGAASSAQAALSVSAGVDVTAPGVTTPGGYVYANDSLPGTLRVEVQRAGALISGSDNGYMSGVDLKAGDTVRVIRNGAEVASLPFDGRPAFDDTVCGTPTSFSGKRTGSSNVSNVYAYKYDRNRYGFYQPTDNIQGDVTTLNGDGFAGTFRKAVPTGHIVGATQTQIPATDVTYHTTIERTVAACSATPVTPTPEQLPTTDVTKPTGKLILPSGKTLTVGNLFDANGLTTEVEVDEAGTVFQAMFLRNGAKVPNVITASTAQKKKKKKRVTIAKGRATADGPGTVKVRLKATKKVRKKYRRSRRLKVVVVTTLRDLAGNTTALPRRNLTLKR